MPIRQITETTGDARFTGRIVFLENYDINVARHMAQQPAARVECSRPWHGG